MNFLSNTIGLHSGRFRYKALNFVQKKIFAVRFRDKFPAKRVSAIFNLLHGFDFMNYFVQMLVEKQHFQLWSSIKSAKFDISKIADTLLLEIFLGTVEKFFEQNKTLCT